MRIRVSDAAAAPGSFDDLTPDAEYDVAGIVISTTHTVSLLVSTGRGRRLAPARMFDLVDHEIPSSWCGVRDPTPGVALWIGPAAAATPHDD
jgi:hypothetical protein